MSRTHHHSAKYGTPSRDDATKNRAPGYEFWSRRPLSNFGGVSPGRWVKKMVHKLERITSDEEVPRYRKRKGAERKPWIVECRTVTKLTDYMVGFSEWAWNEDWEPWRYYETEVQANQARADLERSYANNYDPGRYEFRVKKRG